MSDNAYLKFVRLSLIRDKQKFAHKLNITVVLKRLKEKDKVCGYNYIQGHAQMHAHAFKARGMLSVTSRMLVRAN